MSGMDIAAVGQVTTFSNTNLITINDSVNTPTIATPYPSSIQVTGMTNRISKLTVQLFGITHSFPDDIDIVLVGPQGQNTVLMANVGSETKTPVTNIDLTLDDEAASNLPLDSALVSGTFKPTRRLSSFTFTYPAPAPASPNGASLSNFTGIDPNGTWNLYVIDDASPDSGIISGGWSLTIDTTLATLAISRSGTNVVLSWTNAAVGYTLQSTSALNSNAWSNVGVAPVIVNNLFTVTNVTTNLATFYRLAK